MTETEQAVLGAPWDTHSDEFKALVLTNCRRIIFYDASEAIKVDDKWVVRDTGIRPGESEADVFVNLPIGQL